jgi:hypothetical protein
MGIFSALIVAAVIGIVGRVVQSRPSTNDDKAGELTVDKPAVVRATEPVTPATKNVRFAEEKRYEITTVVAVDKAFTDPETGLTFGVEEVYNESGSWFSPAMKGATITYTLPNGKSDYGGRDVGFREDFMFRGRNFIMVIEAMDFQGHTVTIRIKEV